MFAEMPTASYEHSRVHCESYISVTWSDSVG